MMTARRGRNRPVRIFPGMKETKRDIVAAMADWCMMDGASGRRPPPPMPPQMPMSTIPTQHRGTDSVWNMQ